MTIDLRVTPKLADRLRAAARDRGTSVSDVVRRALARTVRWSRFSGPPGPERPLSGRPTIRLHVVVSKSLLRGVDGVRPAGSPRSRWLRAALWHGLAL